MLYSKDEVLSAVQQSQSRRDVIKILNIPENGNGYRKINQLITDYKIDISHFISGPEKCRIYPVIEKECPVCKRIFITSKGIKKEKQTCSHACSNSYFRCGKNNGNYTNGQRGESPYRVICFQYYSRKCAICDWDKSIDVHHIDGNSKNNEPQNLIPLCANHHRLTVMTQYKDEIRQEIEQIVKNKFS